MINIKKYTSKETDFIFFLCYFAIQYRYIFTDTCDFSWGEFIFLNLFLAFFYSCLILILYHIGAYIEKPSESKDFFFSNFPLRLILAIIGLFPIVSGHFYFNAATCT